MNRRYKAIQYAYFFPVLLLVSTTAYANRVEIDHGHYVEDWIPKKGACQAIGSGEIYNGYPSAESKYAYEQCNARVPGCYSTVLSGNYYDTWYCRGKPSCSAQWNNIHYCEKTRVYYCNKDYKLANGKCESIDCRYGSYALTMGEFVSTRIPNGYKNISCTRNGIKISISCKPGKVYDGGSGCFEIVP